MKDARNGTGSEHEVKFPTLVAKTATEDGAPGSFGCAQGDTSFDLHQP